MIKGVAVLVALSLVLALSGCGPKNPDTSNPSGSSNSSQVEEEIDLNAYDNVSILDFGGAADGSADVSEAFKAAAQAVGDEQAVYFPNGTYRIDTDLSMDCPVKLSGNVSIVVAEGKTLTVNGLFGAGIQPIFTGPGNVRFTNEDVWGYPDWFVLPETADYTQRLQKAVDSLRCVYVAAGTYQLKGLHITQPVAIRGIGEMRVSLNATADTKYLFHIESDDVRIQGIDISMQLANKDAVCWYFDTSSRDLKNITIDSCAVKEGYTSLTDAGSGTHTVTNATFNAVDFQNARHTAIHMRDFKSNISLIEVAVHRRDYGVNYNMGVPGAIIENGDGMLFEHFDVNGEANIVGGVKKDWVARNIGGHGMIFRNCKNVRMIRTLMEYVAGSGFVIENCSHFDFENVQSYTYHGVGFDITGLKDSTFRVVKSSSAGGDPERAEDNYRFKDCENVTFYSTISNDSRDAAVSLQNCKKMTFEGLTVTNRIMGCAIRDLGGNQDVVVNGLIDVGSAGSSVVLTGSGVEVKDALIGREIYEELKQAGTY